MNFLEKSNTQQADTGKMSEVRAPAWIARENLLREPSLLAKELRQRLGVHPVPQSDSRTRGLLVELNNSQAHRDRLRQELPALAEILQSVGDTRPPTLVLAVNETPATHSDSFLMMPHLDRRYRAKGFANATPERTTVVMLDFPSEGVGGELVVFLEEALRENPPNSRSGARAAVSRAQGHLLSPRPGTAYVLPGTQPHAVLGYEAPSGAPRRLVVVIAEFAACLGERPTEWLRLG